MLEYCHRHSFNSAMLKLRTWSVLSLFYLIWTYCGIILILAQVSMLVGNQNFTGSWGRNFIDNRKKLHRQWYKEVGPRRVKIGPKKWAKLKFWQIIFCMKYRFMKMVKFFEFFTIVPEIPSPKHHEIQDFAKNYHISAMKINKMFVF
jgi:hypothetical protein